MNKITIIFLNNTFYNKWYYPRKADEKSSLFHQISCVNNLFFKGRMEYAMITLIIIFGWSRHFHDEMAISCSEKNSRILGGVVQQLPILPFHWSY